MTTRTLDAREDTSSSSPWMRRALLVLFSLGLLVTIVMLFTQVIAARVPQQRATLEKLIADRTGLQVRFENVHFAWNLDGTSAVFERVELTDPVRGRVRVLAPELRVEFDTWDFMRHQRFSLGHVTLSSPDIDIIGDAEIVASSAVNARSRPAAAAKFEDEATWIRRFTGWAELMPIGRIEVEGARVHLFRRGEAVARHDFTLSQAVISRGASNFSAFGTMLLSQDVGQSLFVSAKLEGVGAREGVSGEMRVIARRVLLDKLPGFADHGRGTVDARVNLEQGRVSTGAWQLSGRELQLANGKRFDHFTVRGTLRRAREDLVLDFTDLQVTRGARLERAPRLQARVAWAPGSWQLAQTTVTAERMPFMAAEFVLGALAPQMEERLPQAPLWSPVEGELRDLRLDSRAGTFSARLENAEFLRAADGARLRGLSGQMAWSAEGLELHFDETADMALQLAETSPPRSLRLAGALAWGQGAESPLRFHALRLSSGQATLQAQGAWRAGAQADPLSLEITQWDRGLLADVGRLMQADFQEPALLLDLQEGRIVSGRLQLLPAEAGREGRAEPPRLRGLLQLAELRSDAAALSDAAGTLEFTRTGARLQLTSGRVEDLHLDKARVDWPRRGEPRLRASLQGDLRSSLLQGTFREAGVEDLQGAVELDVDARGEASLRQPQSWRISARLREASLPLSAGLPPVEKLSGQARIADGQLRALTVEGAWLGGPVRLDSRRSGVRGITSAQLSGTADAALLAELFGTPAVHAQVSGRVPWSGTLRREEPGWRASVSANLAGLDSRLPPPFDRTRARPLTMNADLLVDAQGLRELHLSSGADQLRARLEPGLTQTQFEWQGLSGELRMAETEAQPTLVIDRLDLRRAPEVLAAAGALMPEDSGLRVQITELRRARRTLGALQASLERGPESLSFSLESAPGSAHLLTVDGVCQHADGDCRLDFRLRSGQLPVLLGDAELPREWPTRSLDASGQLQWRAEDLAMNPETLSGAFELATQGEDSQHQLMASAALADGLITLNDIEGSGPAPDQIFRGQGRVALQARTYEVALEYEKLSLAASAVPTPARARLARAWSVLRGTSAPGGIAEPERRLEWRGSWD